MDNTKTGGANHRESLSRNVGAVAQQICKEPGGAHCCMYHTTTVGVTHDWTWRSWIQEMGDRGRWWVGWWEYMMGGWQEGKSWVTESGEWGHNMQTSWYSTCKAGYLMIITPPIYWGVCLSSTHSLDLLTALSEIPVTMELGRHNPLKKWLKPRPSHL